MPGHAALAEISYFPNFFQNQPGFGTASVEDE
jgi:hypothetical protein